MQFLRQPIAVFQPVLIIYILGVGNGIDDKGVPWTNLKQYGSNMKNYLQFYLESISLQKHLNTQCHKVPLNIFHPQAYETRSAPPPCCQPLAMIYIYIWDA